MRSKSILFGFATVGAVGSVLISTAAPAEAISIGSSYTISGQGFFTDTSINFVEANGSDPGSNTATALVNSANGDFSVIAPTQPFPGVPIFASFATDVVDIANLNITPFKLVDFNGSFAPLSNDFDFTATSVIFNSTTRRYLFDGFFGDGTLAKGEIAQLESVPGTGGAFGFSGTFTAVPTPALLPGLIGMGIAALKKKQGDEAEQEA